VIQVTERIDLFDNTYRHFTDQVLETVRKETFGTDFGQNSWTTIDEYARLLPWLNLSSEKHALEIASGAGGPALHLARTTGCRVTGIDVNESGVAKASQFSKETGDADRVQFRIADATAELPFDTNAFDALLCIDSMNHFPNRPAVLREWCRVLRPRCRALFTDPVVITGLVTNDELALRSSIGLFVFAPHGANEKLIERAGLQLVYQEDVTENAALIAGRWHQSRRAHRDDLLQIEGKERFEGLQRFFDAVHTLTSERRLSRIAYVAEKR
jgi:SAM-dependent methyltransferase